MLDKYLNNTVLAYMETRLVIILTALPKGFNPRGLVSNKTFLPGVFLFSSRMLIGKADTLKMCCMVSSNLPGCTSQVSYFKEL